jgi:hypothetical protein
LQKGTEFTYLDAEIIAAVEGEKFVYETLEVYVADFEFLLLPLHSD